MLARILVWLALLTAAAFAGEPPVCGGRNLLDDLASQNPRTHAAILAEARAIPNGEAILWRIEGTSGAAPSWLMGTAHLTDPRIARMPAAAEAAIVEARVLALEIKEFEPRDMALASMRHAGAMVLPAGQNLWDMVDDADEAAIRASPSFPKDRYEVFAAYRPWVVAAALSLPACEQARAMAGLAALDTRIGRLARDNGVPVEGLETLESQIAVLSGMPLDLQIKFMVATGKSGAIIGDYIETLVQLYLRRELTALLPLSRHSDPTYAENLDVMAYFEQDLIAKRNIGMRDAAAKLFDGGNAFVAVGALHLPGEQGLVNLLRKSGYTVTPVE